jgi:GH43 family beta-xylosidase
MDVNSKFTYEGLVRGLPVNQWAIDGTIFHINQQLYFVYSGWPLTATDNLKQELFITRMVDPMTADPSTGVHMISTPTFPWESWRDPGNGQVHHINEGPAWLEMGSFKGIIFSASASWTSDYKMGTLQYLGGDPLEISPWKKYPTELLCNNKNGKGPYAPGHCSYYPDFLC